jgi:hypothetical protein
MIREKGIDQEAQPKAKPAARPGAHGGGRLNVRAYLEAHGLEVTGEKPYGDGVMYQLKACAFNPDHGPNEASVVQMGDGKLLYQCFHNSCNGHRWSDLRKLLSDDKSLAQWMEDGTPPRQKKAPRQACQADDGSGSGDNTEKVSAATDIAGLAAGLQLYFDEDGDQVYVDLPTKKCLEFVSVASKVFKDYLAGLYFKKREKAPGSEALSAAIRIISYRGRFESPKVDVFIRTAIHQGRFIIDLADDRRHVVIVDKDGWKITNRSPVKFKRPKALQALPMPERPGNINLLRKHLNIRAEADFILAVAWLLKAFINTGAYPILVFLGEQGVAKSTATKRLRSLVDPNAAPLRSPPRTERDLAVACSNALVTVIENISFIPVWMSDALCRLATGGGFSTRTLYANDEEYIFRHKRPGILNGIANFITRQDLIDRALFISLEPIPEARRKTERELDAAFNKDAGCILAGILDALVVALQNIDTVKLDRLPRMADFAEWVVAGEPALPWSPGKFMEEYDAKRAAAVADAIEDDLLGSAILILMQGRDQWIGTATELLEQLSTIAGDKATRMKAWPKAAHVLGKRLVEMSSFLRKVGIEIDRPARNAKGEQRKYIIKQSGPSAPSGPSSQLNQTDRGRSNGRRKEEQTHLRLPPTPKISNDSGDGRSGRSRRSKTHTLQHGEDETERFEL